MLVLNICESPDILNVIRLIKVVITIIKIVVPILLIISIMIDYTKAVSSNDNDLLTKTNKVAITKIISAMLVFFIPTFVFLISNIASTDSESYFSCFRNATKEKIDEYYSNAAQKLVNKAKDNLSSSDYNIAISSVKRLNNKEDKERMENELKEINELIKEKEQQIPSGYYTDKGFWWPIGSSQTTTDAGITYAKGSPSTLSITSTFTVRNINGNTHKHGGIDIGASCKSNVIASKSGKVSYVYGSCNNNGFYGSTCGSGFGNHIKITHDGGITTIYAHLYPGSIKVSKGQYVNQGQVIALSGNSGSSTGCHLHFEVRVSGNRTNPLNYVSPSNPR